eukprot:TRINITY_DN23188_c0_g1_i1.p1 TRINITY_DN23188_c0_g1~~TRINITY_DN23188_c0_g1_i1.p1  ORF type:complete len:510 (+),score=112.27 TRINITY_DN23188_c0_g1_i1:38-1567(+)
MPCLDALMPWELQQELQKAVLEGDEKLVCELISRIHKDLLDTTDDDDRTPLFNACLLGHGGIVRELVATKGVDVNVNDIEGNTPLYVAASKGHMEAVRHLCIAGADPTIRGTSTLTPFKVSLAAGHTKIADGLMYYELKWRAAFFAKAESQKRATLHKSEEARRQLIRKQQGIHLQATLRIIQEREMAEIMPSDEESDDTQLMQFCQNEIEKLSISGPDIGRWNEQVESEKPRSPSVASVYEPEAESEPVETEEEKKQRFRQEQRHKEHELHQQQLRSVFAQKESKKIPAEEFKLDDQTVDLKTFSPFETLCAAANRGDLDTCVKMGRLTPIDPPVGKGHTPLVWAVVGGQVHVVQWLVSRGVDARRKDSCGYTAMFHAVQHGKDEIIKLLAQHCTELLYDVDHEGHNLVQWAAFSGSTSTLRILVESCRVSLEALDREGKSCLHWGAQQGNIEALQYLLPRCHVELIFQQDCNGLTAEDQARMMTHVPAANAIRSHCLSLTSHRPRNM